MASIVLLVLLGCGKKPDLVETGASEPPQKAGEQAKGAPAPLSRASGPGKTDRAIKTRLAEALPAGHVALAVYQNEEDDDQLLYDVSWARPGFLNNRASFMVKKQGKTVTVDGQGGQWVYEGGKLKKEDAKDGAPPQQWDWMQKRAGEVAEATYKVSR